jgi:hypothetical protein
MSEEAKCDCQHCGVHIEFPAEMAEQTVTCPHCQAETLLITQPAADLPAPNLQPEAEDFSLMFSKIETSLSKERRFGFANYILYLAPGDVRYLGLMSFMLYKPDGWIAYFKQKGLAPEIQGPFGGEEKGLDSVIPEEIFPNPTWEDKFRILHGFAKFQAGYKVPYVIYKYFHAALKLRSLEFFECVDSWVREAWDDFFIAQSFAKSNQHLIIESTEVFDNKTEIHRIAVFKKTSFVMRRLKELLELDEAEKTSENLERLRRSNFTVFVYLMEDLRNGLFKIGQSQTPEKREKTLQSEVPETSLRFYMPAHDTAETELHEMFSKKRVRGEWFELTPQDILSVIEFLKQKGDLSRASADYDWLGKITLGISTLRPA